MAGMEKAILPGNERNAIRMAFTESPTRPNGGGGQIILVWITFNSQHTLAPAQCLARIKETIWNDESPPRMKY